MYEPKLKNNFIKENLYAKQVGRLVVLVDKNGVDVISLPPLTEIESERLNHFTWRLNDAWKELDKLNK